MLENFSHLIERYGFVPNGNRVYFERRSQPPLLTSMTAEYLNATNDLEFLQEHIASLDKEFEFWRTNRSVVEWLYDAEFTQPHSRHSLPNPQYVFEFALSKFDFSRIRNTGLGNIA